MLNRLPLDAVVVGVVDFVLKFSRLGCEGRRRRRGVNVEVVGV